MNRVIPWLTGAATTLGLMAVVQVVSAHVVVTPATSQVSAWEQYTMRVPCEKTDPTTKIVLKLPSDVALEQYEAVPGWRVTTGKAGSQNIVTWQAKGAGIQPGQFQEFSFMAKNPSKPTTIDWDAYQYYKDGSIVTWTGEPGSSTPHSVTNIVSAAPGSTATSAVTPQQVTATPNGLGWTTADTLVLTVAVVAILLSGLALGFSLKDSKKQ